MLGEFSNILRAFPQGRDIELNDIQTIEQVLSKLLLLHHRQEVLISGSDQPDIRFKITRSSDALKLSFLKHSEQFHLHRG